MSGSENEEQSVISPPIKVIFLSDIMIEEFRKISGGKSKLSLGNSTKKTKSLNDCPNPTCVKGTKHCRKCRALGIEVCGTTAKGHHVYDSTNNIWRRRFDNGDVRHSEIPWKEMRDDDVKRVFNIHDKEIRKRGWFDARP